MSIVNELQKKIRVAKENPWDILAECYGELGKQEKRIAELEQALESCHIRNFTAGMERAAEIAGEVAQAIYDEIERMEE